MIKYNKKLIMLIMIVCALSSCSNSQKPESVPSPSEEAKVDSLSTLPIIAPEDIKPADELPGQQESSTPEQADIYLTTGSVNLREAPNIESSRIITVPQGKAVKIKDFNDFEWFLVDYEGQIGYMKAEFLTAGAYQLVVPFQYLEVGDYSDGMAKIRLTTPFRDDAKIGDSVVYEYGFIDKIGFITVPCEYSNVGSFSDGMAWVRRGDVGDVYEISFIVDDSFHLSEIQSLWL